MLKKMSSSVKFKLLSTVLLITLIPLMLAGFLNYKTSSEAVYEMAKQDLSYITQLKVKELNGYLNSAGEVQGDHQAIDAIVQEVHQSYYQPAGLSGYGYLLDEQGIAIAHLNPDLVGFDVTTEDFGQHIMATKEGYYEYPWQGEMRVASYRQLDNGWIFAITLPLKDLYSSIEPVKVIMFVLSLVFSLISIGVGFFMVNQIIKPMNILVEAMKIAETGDLRVQVEVKSTDEIGRLSHIYNEMLLSFQRMLAKMQEVSEQVAASSEELTASANESSKASEQIAVAATEIASSAEGQVDSVSISTSSIHEMNQKIESIVQQVFQVNEISKEGTQHAKEGEASLKKVIGEMDDITQKSSEAQEVINFLGSQSEAIRGIISTIRDINEQTNLLALNAAIEAARAGEQGKSFAVVADQIRHLAMESGQAAEEITNLIEMIHQEIQKAMLAMTENISAVHEGQTVVTEATDSFQKIMGTIAEMNDKVSVVNQSASEIGEESKKIVASADQIADLAQNVAADTEEVAAASEEQTATMQEINAASEVLARMAEELQAEVRRFKV